MFFHCTFYHSHHSASISETTNKVRGTVRVTHFQPYRLTRPAVAPAVRIVRVKSNTVAFGVGICLFARRPRAHRHQSETPSRSQSSTVFVISATVFLFPTHTRIRSDAVPCAFFFRNDFFLQLGPTVCERYVLVQFHLGASVYICVGCVVFLVVVFCLLAD